MEGGLGVATAVRNDACASGYGTDHRPRPLDDHRSVLRGRLAGDDGRHQPQPGGHRHRRDAGHAAGRAPQPGPRLRDGDDFVEAWYDAERGELDPFILIIEGSIANEQINGEGHWTGFGVNPFDGQPITINEWVDRLAPTAAAVVAVGTCATYGGIPAMKNNPTGAMGLPDYLGWNWRTRSGLPDRLPAGLPGPAGQHDRDPALPGPSPRRHGAGAGARRAAAAARGCSAGRPARAAAGPASPSRASSPPSTATTRAAWSSSAARARSRKCNVPVRGWVNGIGGCPNVGGICIGLHDARLPRQVHAVHGPRPVGQRGGELPALHLRAALPLLPQPQPRARSSSASRTGAGPATRAEQRLRQPEPGPDGPRRR